MRWRVAVFESAFVRKFAYMLAAALFAFLAAKAHATTPCYAWTDDTGATFPDPTSAVTSTCSHTPFNGSCGTVASPTGFGGSQTAGGVSCPTPTGTPPTSVTCQITVTSIYTYGNGQVVVEGVNTVGQGTSQVVITCPPNNCTATSGHDYNMATGQTAAAPGSTMCDSTGCEFTASPAGTARYLIVGGAGGAQWVQTATGTGASCSPTGIPPQTGAQTNNGTDNSTCLSGSGNIACATQSASGKNCGTYNGDQVCVSDVPAGTCVAYASGGVACTTATVGAAATTPPSPNNGTPGVAATPSETVSTPAGTTNYYNSAVVNNSSFAVTTSGTGASGSKTGTGAGTGTGTGTGTGAGGAVSADCAFNGSCSDGTLPAAPTVATVQSSTTSYISAVTSAPIVQAFGNISAAIPSGTCPAPQFTIWGHTFTMDAACSIFDQVSSILSAICLIVYTMMSVRVLMSA